MNAILSFFEGRLSGTQRSVGDTPTYLLQLRDFKLFTLTGGGDAKTSHSLPHTQAT